MASDVAYIDKWHSRRVVITLLGRPTPGTQQKHTANGVRFIPKRQTIAMDELKHAATQAMFIGGYSAVMRPMLTGPLQLTLLAEMPIPQTWSKKKQAAAIAGAIWPTTKPDLKNLLWLAEDALKSVVYADDNIICKHNTIKRYSAHPKIVITVEPIDSPQ